MTFPKFFVLRRCLLERLRHLRDQLRGEFVPFRGMRFDSGQLRRPGGKRSAFKGARSHRRIVSNAKAADFLRLAIVVFPTKGSEFGGVFLLDRAPLAIKLLYLVEPLYPIRHL